MKEWTIRMLPSTLELNELVTRTHKDLMGGAQSNQVNAKGSRTPYSRGEIKMQRKMTIKNPHSKTEPIERPSKYELPELNQFSNALIEMKSNEIERSSKLIISSNKNTRILNDIIDILREDKQDAQNRNMSRTKIKKLELPNNEFLPMSEDKQDRQKDGPVFQRGPKIINPEFIKICDGKLFSRRNIFSEERSRTRPKAKRSLNININDTGAVVQNPNLLTFYRPGLKKANTMEGDVFRNLNQDIQIHF